MRLPDFAPSRCRITLWAAAMLCVALPAIGFAVEQVVRLGDMRDEVERIEARIEHRQHAVERERRRQKSMTPEQKRIERVIAAQQANANTSGLPVVERIEHAWTPEIALTALTIDKAGSTARIEGGSADLSQIYQFVDRLNNRQAEHRTGLLQHSTKVIDGRSIFLFSVSVETP
ncbi:hypothetical protein [Burkholderia pseudomallei]|uniref:hypothetical protein n=1 Tax=Burkholderia pseudomallei TaxID=28450 RepID=UPI000A1A0455|nr:hypothetical protein [Burkholderia pseudomallei]ARL38875.1 hypothetical protein BOC49_21770 [Burkholderia pseudomallei]